ncbi:MAG TPA: TonB-dependent receptor [Roseateles sp.]|uniref:TonB-dependent receptor plug domain-containing protein n=1 Tax=Roseateles sp. TaxID=1971397 RepID=UPI002ED9D1A9
MNKHRNTRLALALLGAGLVSLPAWSQEQAQQLERITVTGSSIKRLESETALPVSVVTRDQIVKSGATNVEDILRRIGANTALQSDTTQGAGYAQSFANLRGLGPNSTLVLLNGRRLANFAFGSIGGNSSVDLNSIPFAAIDRIEVLRDGASAVYGTDAVGGVINFITRKDYDKGELTLRYGNTEKNIGGKETGASLAFGMGGLKSDGYNLLVTGNVKKQTKLSAIDQKWYLRGAEEIPGSDPPTSGRSFPGRLVDFGITPGAYANAGANFSPCDPNFNTIQTLTDTTPNGTPIKRCRFIYPAMQENLPDTTKADLFGRLSLDLGQDSTLFFEASYARSKGIGRTAPVPIDSTAGHVKADGTYPSFAFPITSKYFPVALLTSLGYTPDQFDTLGGGFTEIAMRSVPVGLRTNNTLNEQTRLVAGLTGMAAGWDYDAGLTVSQAKGSLDYYNYLHEGRFIAELASGVINPFGPQDAAGLAALDRARMEGPMRRSKSTTYALDAKASRELMALPGGPMMLAVGADLRKEKANDRAVNPDYEQGLHIGGEGTVPNTTASRSIYAVFSELSMPFATGWEATVKARYDHYSDFGSTFNPGLTMRFQPSKALLLRASAGTGFRAPTLWDVNSPMAFTNTANSLVDPGCPAGHANDPRCETQFNVRLSSDPGLKPEKSRQYSFGVVVEPLRDLSIALDYWHIQKKDQISVIGGDAIMADPTLYQRYNARIHRLSSGFISYIETPVENLGELKTSGLDVDVKTSWGLGDWGRLGASFVGTYVNTWKQQNGKGTPFVSYQGTAGDGASVQPVPKWQHTLGLDWNAGNWNLTLENVFVKGWTESAGLVEANVGPAVEHKVKDSSRWNMSVGWKPIAPLALRLGARNLFNQDPPFTAVSSYGSHVAGYAGSFVDPRGRFWYMTASYQFK